MTARIDTAARPAWRRPQPSQVGMVVFLASDVMLFAAFFAAYFLLRTENQPWPPADVDLTAGRAAAATCVLVASSFTMIAADRSFEAGRRVQARRWLVTTLVLGAAFLANQFAEYATLDFLLWATALGAVRAIDLGRAGAALASGAAGALLSVIVISATTPLIPTYAERLGSSAAALADQRNAGPLMWISGMLTTVPLVIAAFWRWATREQQLARRREQSPTGPTRSRGGSTRRSRRT